MLLHNQIPRIATYKLLQVLFVFSTSHFLYAFGQLAPVIPLNNNQCQQRCTSEVCGSEALRFVRNIDDQVDPCENFYEFACGNYIKNTRLPPSLDAVSYVVDAQKKIHWGVLAELAKPISDSDLEAVRKIKAYFQNCKDETRTEEAGVQPVLDILDSIGGWPLLLRNRWDERRFYLMRSIYKLKEYKRPEFFPAVLNVDIDKLDSSKFAINLLSAETDVDAAWFINGDRTDASESFAVSIMNVVIALGVQNDSTTLDEVEQLINFEAEIFNITTPSEKLVDLTIEESRTTIRELSRKYPSIPWLEFINKLLNPSGINVNENEVIYLADPSFISKVVKLIERTPKRVLANYLAWRTIQQSLPYLPRSVNEAGTVSQARIQPKIKCFFEVNDKFPLGLSAMFVRKNPKDPIKDQIAEMFENRRHQTRKILEGNDWMDDDTRQAALEKLDAMRATIGYADELMDDRKVNDFYRDLEVTPGSFLESGFNVSFFSENLNNKKLRKSTAQDNWATKQSVVELNAYNIVQENSIEIPSGFLKSFYKSGRPEYINYGSLAIFIGHEVFHGFDNEGRQYDLHGNQLNWWQSSTEEKFKQKAKCIIDQYNNFTVERINLNVNGELSQGENIADNGGFRAAYLAYKEWARKNNPEGCLPSMNFTPQQMFWISAASVWCSKESDDYLRQSMTTDPHSPDEARVQIVFSNIKEFADDFKCKPGSRMNPEKRCKMW